MPDLAKLLKYSLLLVALLWSVAEQGRSLLPDYRRAYASLVLTALLSAYLFLEGGLSKVEFGKVLIASYLAPLASVPLVLLRGQRGQRKEQQESSKKLSLLELASSSSLILCKSARLANGILGDLAAELSETRRVVLVDWFGNLRERFGEYKLALPNELWLCDPGHLDDAYFLMVSDLISLFVDANPSLVVHVLKNRDFEILEDAKVPPELRIILESLFSPNSIPLLEALPESAGVLIVDASGLSPQAKEVLSLLVLLQSAAYRKRDFIPLTPSISPWEQERGKEVLRWLANSLEPGGGIIASKFVLKEYAKEFSYVLQCEGCQDGLKVGQWSLCPHERV